MWNLRSRKLIATLEEGFRVWPLGGAISADNRTLVANAGGLVELHIWSLPAGLKVMSRFRTNLFEVFFSPKGDFVKEIGVHGIRVVRTPSVDEIDRAMALEKSILPR